MTKNSNRAAIFHSLGDRFSEGSTRGKGGPEGIAEVNEERGRERGRGRGRERESERERGRERARGRSVTAVAWNAPFETSADE